MYSYDKLNTASLMRQGEAGGRSLLSFKREVTGGKNVTWCDTVEEIKKSLMLYANVLCRAECQSIAQLPNQLAEISEAFMSLQNRIRPH